MRGFAFVAWLAQAAVVVGMIVPPACADACADEENEGDEDCSPRCPTCTCAHAQRPLIAAWLTVVDPRRSSPTRPCDRLAADPPADPEPRGIFHPPRP